MKIIDFSSRFPTGKDLKADGVGGVVLYLSPARADWMKGKDPSKAVIDDYKRNGIEMAFVWQYGKLKPDVMRGTEGGLLDARAADAKLKSLGLDGYPVFFAVDFDINLDQWNSTAVNYFRAVGSVLGENRVGIYGHSRVVHWAMEDNVVASVGPGRVLGWVTRSWSNGETGADYAVLYQRVHDTVSPVLGLSVDINDPLHEYWGNGKVAQARSEPVFEGVPEVSVTPNPGWRGDPTFLPEVLKAFGVKVEEFEGWRDRGHGDFGKIQGIVCHHIGSNHYHPSNIARHPELGLCSQIHLSRSGVATIVGAGIAWHAGAGNKPGWPTNNANQVAIGIEAESDGVSPWPAEELDAYYRCCAAILWFLGKRATPETLISHWEYSRHVQGKWDPGAGNGQSGAVMDMDNFRRRVQNYIDKPPFKAKDEITEMDLSKRYKSRVEGSDFEGSLLDFILNADAHAFVARANTEHLDQRLKQLEAKLDQVLEVK